MVLSPTVHDSDHKKSKFNLCINMAECIDTYQYHIAGYTIPKFNKEKNGDDFRVAYLKEEQLIIGVVSDGVSQQPCDWLASELSCQCFIDAFLETNQADPIPSRIKQSIAKANRQLLDTPAPCSRLAATISACVVDEQAHKAYFCNIGDSRIFAVQATAIQPLTKDDTRTVKQVLRTAVGKRIVQRVQLTQCMGKSSLIPVVQERELNVGDVLILASDGFYEARKASFHAKLIEFQRNDGFEEAFGRMASSFEIMRDDDMTVVAIQRKSL